LHGDPSGAGEGTLYRFGLAIDDPEQHTRRTIGMPSPLLPVLERASVEPETSGELRSAQAEPRADSPYVDIIRDADVLDTPAAVSLREGGGIFDARHDVVEILLRYDPHAPYALAMALTAFASWRTSIRVRSALSFFANLVNRNTGVRRL
jgi:hypothetical protein